MTAEIPIRQPTRLANYDYSTPGAYFVTICCQNRKPYFSFEPAKKMVEKWWFELAQKNSSIELDEFAVMPDHFHGILILKSPVGEGLCALPSGGSIRRCSPTNSSSLIDIVQWFKTMTTNEYIRGVRNENWLPFTGKLWQRSFYEHIVRNDADLQILREYIQNNPLALEMDAV